MNVIHIIPSLDVGGAESQLEQLITESSRSTPDVQHIVICLLTDVSLRRKRLEGLGVRVLSCDLKITYFIQSILRLRSLIKLYYSNDTTVIQCWMYHANVFGFFIARSLGISKRIVWNIRRTEVPKGATGILSNLAAKLSHKFNIPIVCCAFSAKYSHYSASYNLKNMIVIHNGINTKNFYPCILKRAAFRKEIKVQDDDFIIGMVGRYAPIKGHIYLLEAFQILRMQYPELQLKLVLVGRGVGESEILKEYFQNPNLKNHIILLQERSDIINVMNGIDLLCLPSLSEGFPNVVAEAMACGCPATVTDVGDASIIVGEQGYIVKPQCAQQLSSKLYQLYEKCSSNKGEIAEQARNRVVHNFSVAQAWKKYYNLYLKIIESN